ncbi:MAG: 30S ribosomal protein S8 [Candidatus Aenigmatarchaeota archaeon]
MRHDLLSDVLSTIKNGDLLGKKDVVTPASTMIKNVLLVLQSYNYIGNFEFIDNARGGKFKVSLLGTINNCGSIRPRFRVKKEDYEKYERRFLPASGFGVIIVSTSEGVMSHEEAKKRKIGGRLLVFVY